MNQNDSRTRLVRIEKTRKEVWDILCKRAYKEQDPAMLVLYGNPYKNFDGAIKIMHTNDEGKRVANEILRGTFCVMLDICKGKEGSRIAFDATWCIDRDLFWQTVENLLLLLRED